MPSRTRVVLLATVSLLATGCKNEQPQPSKEITASARTPDPAKAPPQAPKAPPIASEPAAPPPDVPALSKGVVLRVEKVTFAQGSRSPVVHGVTNLPDGTELSVSIQSKAGGFPASDDAVVRDRRFFAGPFYPSEGLPDGVYTVEFLMPVPSTQSKAVQQVIGAEGEHLKGKLVVREDGDVTVESKSEIYVGGEESATAATRQRAKDITSTARELRTGLKALLVQAKKMDSHRAGGGRPSTVMCARMQERLQPEAKRLAILGENLPLQDYMDLKTAANMASLCVICLQEQADQGCDSIRENLARDRRAHRK